MARNATYKHIRISQPGPAGPAGPEPVFKEGYSRCSNKDLGALEYQLKPSKKCQPRVVSFAFAQFQGQEYSTKTFFLKTKSSSDPNSSISEHSRAVENNTKKKVRTQIFLKEKSGI